LVDHLEKNTPQIFKEIRRLRELIWDDYIDIRKDNDATRKLILP
jgi:hypothetical protein